MIKKNKLLTAIFALFTFETNITSNFFRNFNYESLQDFGATERITEVAKYLKIVPYAFITDRLVGSYALEPFLKNIPVIGLFSKPLRYNDRTEVVLEHDSPRRSRFRSEAASAVERRNPTQARPVLRFAVFNREVSIHRGRRPVCRPRLAAHERGLPRGRRRPRNPRERRATRR